MQLSTAREQDRGWTPARENTEAGSDSNAGKRTLVEGAGKLIAYAHWKKTQLTIHWAGKNRTNETAVKMTLRRSSVEWKEAVTGFVVTLQIDWNSSFSGS